MARSIFALLLATLTSLVIAQDKPSAFTTITVDVSSYQVGESKAQSLDTVIGALRAQPRLEAVGISGTPGTSQERVDAVIEAIRKSGLKLRIGLVGNEVFTR
jgi:methylmalonyl-CoA mutase cobalamin-binding subunit